LVPTGPLTNIAVAMRMEPRILPKIKEIVLMGGAYGTGNFTPSAEFNILADPEAARVVFTAGVPLVMMGLDLTNQTVCTPDIIERMEAVGNRAGSCSATCCASRSRPSIEAFGLAAGRFTMRPRLGT
jgi:Inosine-uridine nucleoside N-ribohydrolase